MASKTEIANLAILHLGQGKEISNLETEKSAEAATMRRYYPVAVETALKDFSYTFCNVITALDLVAEDPNDEWDYSYRYPTNCLMPLRILSGTRNDTEDTKVVFKVGKDDTGKLIYTDQPEAQLEYTEFVDDPSKYPSDFIMALSFLLAALSAPRICGEDPFKMGERSLRMYQFFKGKADSNDENSQQAEKENDAEQIRARG